LEVVVVWVSASQGVCGTTIDCSGVDTAWKSIPSIVGVSKFQESLSADEDQREEKSTKLKYSCHFETDSAEFVECFEGKLVLKISEEQVRNSELQGGKKGEKFIGSCSILYSYPRQPA
jgi:hypothetical protein